MNLKDYQERECCGVHAALIIASVSLQCSYVSTQFLDLLKQIVSRVIIYEPSRRTTRELTEFQDTVQRLQEMERLGLISRLFMQTRTTADGEFVDLAMVQGGLTAQGARLLQEHENQSEQNA